jgi:hypothetical protein
LGFRPEIHEEAVNLYGYQGDKREQKAHIVLPRSQVGGSSNDIGFERKEDGKLILHISEFDKRSTKFNEGKFKQLYAKNKLLKKVKKSGKYHLKGQEVTADGKIKVRLTITG